LTAVGRAKSAVLIGERPESHIGLAIDMMSKGNVF
jgi:hypothetical protein